MMENETQVRLVEFCSCHGRFGTFIKDCLLHAIDKRSEPYTLPKAIEKLNSFFSIVVCLMVKEDGFFIELYENNEALGLILLDVDKKEMLWKRVENSGIEIGEIF